MPMIRPLMLAVCLATCTVPASASLLWPYESTSSTGPLGQTWTGSWADGWDIAETVSRVEIDGNSLSYNYHGGGAPFGTPTQTYVFSTKAASAGALTFDLDLRSNEQWDGSSTSMYVWQGDVSNAQLLAGATAGALVRRSVTLNLGQGEAWGFKAVSGSIGDDLGYSGAVYGSFTFVDASTGNKVPEPGSLALLGLGLGGLGLFSARRKR